MGTKVQPLLARTYTDYERLDIPTLEWAGRVLAHDGYRYELIGEGSALTAIGVIEDPMLTVGRSGRKSGTDLQGVRFVTEKLAGTRFRLCLIIPPDVHARVVQEGSLTKLLNGAPVTPRELPSPPAQLPTVTNGYDSFSESLMQAGALVRKFPLSARKKLSQGLLDSRGNGWQLMKSFPWLAVCVFVLGRTNYEARNLVRSGAKVREIADVAEVPMSFKRFCPGACSKRLVAVRAPLYRRPEIVSHHCPKGLRKQQTWLRSIGKAFDSGDENFGFWVAVHWGDLSVAWHQTPGFVSDLADWVKAGVVEQGLAADTEIIRQAMIATSHSKLAAALCEWREGRGVPMVAAGRAFDPNMNVSTVLRLSEEWHERVCESEAFQGEFPEPWFADETVDGYRIEAILTPGKLNYYGRRLHNCASAYAENVADGACFMYVVFDSDGNLEGMFKLDREMPANRAVLGQIKSTCNRTPSNEMKVAAQTWLRDAKRPAPKNVELLGATGLAS